VKDRLRAVWATALADLHDGLHHRLPDELAPVRAHVDHGGSVLVIAFGKAARAMARRTLATLPAARVRGLLVPPEPDDAPLPPLEVIPGGHPLPTSGSLRAGGRALELCRTATAADHVVFLISGGGSAMLEVPLDPRVSLAELRTFYAALIGSGAPIAAVNDVRRHLSAVKGGRLAEAAAGAAHLHSLFVVDTPQYLDVASGPTIRVPGDLEHARWALQYHGLEAAVPAALRERLAHGTLPPAPAEHAAFWNRTSECVVLSAWHAARRLTERLRADGCLCVEDDSVDDLPYEHAADVLTRRLDRLRRRHPGQPVAVVTTGELSVPLPAEPGIGGRNQQFVLACARRIRGRPITVLSCGTDGVDGNSPAAGALADGTTMSRARARGLDVHAALRRCDAFPLLHALGDTVVTGPTGTNVRDVRLLVYAG
jgi:hydroxypyruvate reductase